MTLEQRVEELEKRLADIEKQIQSQPSTETIVDKIKASLNKEIKSAFAKEFALDCDTHIAL